MKFLIVVLFFVVGGLSRAESEGEAIQRDVYGRELALVLREDVIAKNRVQQYLQAMDEKMGTKSSSLSARLAYEISMDDLLSGMANYYATQLGLEDLRALRDFFRSAKIRAMYYRIEDLPPDITEDERQDLFKRMERSDPVTYNAWVGFLSTETYLKLRKVTHDAEALRAELMLREMKRALDRAQSAPPASGP